MITLLFTLSLTLLCLSVIMMKITLNIKFQDRPISRNRKTYEADTRKTKTIELGVLKKPGSSEYEQPCNENQKGQYLLEYKVQILGG